jgi:hypothetical protein
MRSGLEADSSEDSKDLAQDRRGAGGAGSVDRGVRGRCRRTRRRRDVAARAATEQAAIGKGRRDQQREHSGENQQPQRILHRERYPLALNVRMYEINANWADLCKIILGSC